MNACTACNGTGYLDPECEECDGEGWVWRDRSDNPEMVPCPSCRRSEHECELCNGLGS